MREILFGDCCLELDTHVLARGTHRVSLEPRVSDLLEFFLQRQGEVHSHDQLVHSVWDGRCVSDEAVRRGVCSLRGALFAMSGPELAICIRTVYKRGYIARFPPVDVAISIDPTALPSCSGPDATCELIDECKAFLLLHPAERLRRESDAETALDCLQHAVNLGCRMRELVHDLVDVAETSAEDGKLLN